jgi:hypothetical protein
MTRSALYACSALMLALPVRAEAPLARPVLVGGYGELDACPSMGAIIPLRKGGDGYVSVRAAPSRKARELDRLTSGRELLLCQESDDGEWVGVIYPGPFGDAGPGDCGVSQSAEGPPQPYDGVCLSGWVARRYVVVTAG